MALTEPPRPKPLDRPLVVGALTLAAIVVPWIVAVVAFNRPRWYPIADLAQTELRVRDVGTGDSPLVGLAGRIGPWYDPGSHPGPLSFWALAPVYRILGGSAAALSVSAVALHSLAAAVCLWLAHRRGGVRMILGVGAAIVLVALSYGAIVEIEPWNPYLPTTWWLVVLIAAWSVLDDDPPALVVAVAAGSFCAQTHLPYLGLVGAIGALVAAAAGWRIWRGAEGDAPGARRRRVLWLVAALVVGVVLWIPPVIDELTGVGNLSRVRDSLSHPDGEPVGVVQGVKEVVERFDPTRWFHAIDIAQPPSQSDWNLLGLLALAAWGATAVWAVLRQRHQRPSLVRLHVLLAATTVLGAFAASRIHGELWYYLYLWLTGVAALMLLAVGWTVVAEVRDRAAPDGAPQLDRVLTGATAVVLAVGLVVGLVRAPDVQPSRPDLSGELGSITRQTLAALRSGEVPGGDDGRYLVRWEDPFTIGSRGVGLVNELEREGYDAGVEYGHRVGGTRHRVIDPDDATTVLVVAVGEPGIQSWRAREAAGDDVVEVAFVESRTPAEVDESRTIAARIDRRLREEGLDDRADSWRGSAFTDSLDPDLPQDVRDDLHRYVEDLGQPMAVFAVDPALIDG